MKPYAACLAVVLLLPWVEARSCSCAKQLDDPVQGVSEALESATTVFLGIVETKSILPSKDQERGERIEESTFYVRQSWKGEKATRVTTRIDTQCCVCGISFELGATYLVYANDRDGDGYYSTSICSRTKKEENAASDLEILNQMQASSEDGAT